MEELAAGLWRWTARHPEWHPGEWGCEVAAFAVDAGDVTLLIDPLVEAPDQLDSVVTESVAILITIPYHTRSAESLRDRYSASIHGHPAVTKRLRDRAGFEPIEPGAELPGGARAFAIGKPRRFEMPRSLMNDSAAAAPLTSKRFGPDTPAVRPMS